MKTLRPGQRWQFVVERFGSDWWLIVKDGGMSVCGPVTREELRTIGRYVLTRIGHGEPVEEDAQV